MLETCRNFILRILVTSHHFCFIVAFPVFDSIFSLSLFPSISVYLFKHACLYLSIFLCLSFSLFSLPPSLSPLITAYNTYYHAIFLQFKNCSHSLEVTHCFCFVFGNNKGRSSTHPSLLRISSREYHFLLFSYRWMYIRLPNIGRLYGFSIFKIFRPCWL